MNGVEFEEKQNLLWLLSNILLGVSANIVVIVFRHDDGFITLL